MATTRIGGRGVLRGLIADIQPLWQNALASTLTRLGFGSVAVCESLDELAELVERTQPHLVLVDPDGFPRFAEQTCIGDGGCPPVVAVVSAHAERPAGRVPDTATAFVSKRSSTREIEQALHAIVEEHLDWATLTKRELEILRLVATGSSNRQIAGKLWLSDQTVKFHLAQAYRKLGVSDRRAAVARVRAIGLLLDEADPPLPEALIESVRTNGRVAPGAR